MACLVVFIPIAHEIWVIASMPSANDMLEQLQSCPISEVTAVRIYDFESMEAGMKPTITMTGTDAVRVLKMIADASWVHPQHPRGGTTLYVEIDTRKFGTSYLNVSSTENNGVLASLNAYAFKTRPNSDSQSIHNDDLIELFTEYAQVRRASRHPVTQP